MWFAPLKPLQDDIFCGKIPESDFHTTMNIAINARVLTERAGGPARYTRNLIRELTLIDRRNTYYLLMNEDMRFDFPLPDNFIRAIRRTNIRTFYDYIYLPFFSWRNDIDLWLFPKNTYSPMIKGKKIPVYHDIIYFEKELGFREFKFFDNLHHTVMIPVAARHSSINLTVSDYTADRMKTLLGIPEEKIRIVKEGVESSFRRINDRDRMDKLVTKYGLHTPFFFYSGSLSPRKNMLRVIRAFQKCADVLRHNLYFTGGDSWRDNAVFQYIENNNLSHRVKKLGFISDEELVTMYNLADCYLYPSLYEGFGLPILEAQACGCPVITSTATSCPEVAGEGALLIDPYNEDEIASAMMNIANNNGLREKLIEKGLRNCSVFSWEKTASAVLQLFSELENTPPK